MIFLIICLVVACVAWTVTQERVFEEPRNYCAEKSESCKKWWQRKLFYIPTCHYCFSHYVAALVLLITGYRLPAFSGIVGFVVTFFVVVLSANVVITFYSLLRQLLKKYTLNGQITESRMEKPKVTPEIPKPYRPLIRPYPPTNTGKLLIKPMSNAVTEVHEGHSSHLLRSEMVDVLVKEDSWGVTRVEVRIAHGVRHTITNKFINGFDMKLEAEVDAEE